MIAKPRRGKERLASFTISGMALEDIAGVLVIETASFPTPWSESAFRYEIQENPYASLFVAKTREGSVVIAFGCVWMVDQEMKINNLAVHPDFRGRGVGGRFLKFLLEYAAAQGCCEVTLEVRPSNEVALHLYRKSGFVPVGRRKQYYSDTHEDAIVMWHRVEPRPPA